MDFTVYSICSSYNTVSENTLLCSNYNAVLENNFYSYDFEGLTRSKVSS